MPPRPKTMLMPLCWRRAQGTIAALELGLGLLGVPGPVPVGKRRVEARREKIAVGRVVKGSPESRTALVLPLNMGMGAGVLVWAVVG